jgi:hypothetical protein
MAIVKVAKIVEQFGVARLLAQSAEILALGKGGVALAVLKQGQAPGHAGDLRIVPARLLQFSNGLGNESLAL